MMKMRALALGAALMAAGTGAAGPAWAATDQQTAINEATATIQDAEHDGQFGTAPQLLRRAKAVLIVPQLVKGGFFVGGEGGTGVLIARHGNGSWGQPAFYVIGSASFGLQIGVEVNEMVMFIMSDRALHALERDQVKLGAQAGLSVLVVGSNAQAAATTNGNVDIIVWAKSKGAYAGITLEGSVVKPRNEWNAAYYGHPVNSAALISGSPAYNRGADPLRAALPR